jgi:hypothetical protein
MDSRPNQQHLGPTSARKNWETPKLEVLDLKSGTHKSKKNPDDAEGPATS